MELFRAIEVGRDFDPVTGLRDCSTAVIQDVLPTRKASRIRLTVQEIVIVLADEVRHIINGIGSGSIAVVINDDDLCDGLRAKRDANGIAQGQIECLMAFEVSPGAKLKIPLAGW